jgi:galactokinase
MNARHGGAAGRRHAGEPAPSIEELVSGTTESFTSAFGHAPTHAAAAPGRVNLIGEHTDYNGGFVLPIAIDRVCVAVGRLCGRPGLHAVVREATQRRSVEALRGGERSGPGTGFDGRATSLLPDDPRPRPGSWESYVVGVAAGMAGAARTGRPPRVDSPTPKRDSGAGPGPAPQDAARLPGVEIALTTSVPIGGGLSSSAAVEVAVATLLEQLWDIHLDPIDKALLCQWAEHEHAGVPCGIMDQFASVLGRAGHALLIDCRSREFRHVPMPGGVGRPEARTTETQAAIVISNTNVRHSLASGEYAARRRACEAAAAALGVPLLRDATPESVQNSPLTDEQRRCARHVVSENARTLAAAESLARGDLAAMGRLMGESHRSLRDDLRVSCPELDTLVDLAGQSDGVYGARMTGGGFGGCIVALARPDAVPALDARLREGYRAAHGRECSVFETAASGGARAIPLPS